MAQDILPGQFITQREMAAITGMPLGAIRELIPRLEADGLIKTIPQRGMQIAPADVNLTKKAFQLRLIFEREAIAEFCRSAPSTLVTAISDQHRALTEEMVKCITAGLLERAQAIDLGFHEQIIDHLGNDLISKAYRVNAIKIRLIRPRETRIIGALLAQVRDEHLAIIEAVIANETNTAVIAMETHIESARRRALEI